MTADSRTRQTEYPAVSLASDVYRAIRQRAAASGALRRARWSLAFLRWQVTRLRELYLATSNPRERAALIRFALGHFLTRRSRGASATIYLHGSAHVIGLATAEIFIL